MACSSTENDYAGVEFFRSESYSRLYVQIKTSFWVILHGRGFQLMFAYIAARNNRRNNKKALLYMTFSRASYLEKVA